MHNTFALLFGYWEFIFAVVEQEEANLKGVRT